MKKAAFAGFLTDLKNNRYLKALKLAHNTYHHFDGVWSLAGTPIPETTPILETLKKVAFEKIDIVTKDAIYIHVEAYSAAVEISFPPRTRRSKKEEVATVVRECALNSENHFYATHDKLTGLFNRMGFEKEFHRLVKRSETDDADGEYSSPDEFVALLTFDIDLFKQLNDSYGHTFGDIVLRAFAWELEAALQKLDSQDDVKFILSRPGGEEFEIAIITHKSPNDVFQIAEKLRLAICTPNLPNDDQLKTICRDLGVDAKQQAFPELINRKVSASGGISYRKAKGSSKELYQTLKKESDAALYRAKADGRNCIRQFLEIRKYHGRVLGHYGDEGIISIDIGTDVGVTKGDVFTILAQPFDGEYPVTKDDGRSKKKLGTYPKIAQGRIAVFDAQQEISFCIPIEQSAPTFTVGGQLTMEPTGVRPITLTSLAPKSALGGIVVIDEICEHLKFLLCSESSLAMFLFANGSRDDSLRDSLVAAVQFLFSKEALVGYVGVDDLVVVATTTYNKEQIEEKLGRVIFAVQDKPTLSVSALIIPPNPSAIPLETANETSRDIPQAANLRCLTPDQLIHLLYATKFASTEMKTWSVAWFDSKTPQTTLHKQRRGKRLQDAIIDYKRFIASGLMDSQGHNQLALAILEAGDEANYNLASTALKIALEFDPQNTGLNRNLGLALTFSGNYKKAFPAFKKGGDIEERHWIYLLANAVSALNCYKSDRRSIKIDQLRLIAKNAIEIAYPRTPIEKKWSTELITFLNS